MAANEKQTNSNLEISELRTKLIAAQEAKAIMPAEVAVFHAEAINRRQLEKDWASSSKIVPKSRPKKAEK